MSDPVGNVLLGVVPNRQIEGNAGVIKALEAMLEIAKEGKLTAIAIAVMGADGYSSTNYEDGGNKAALLGSVLRLQHRLLTDDNSD